MPKTISKPPEHTSDDMLTLITSTDTNLSEDIVTEFLASYADLKVEYTKLKACLNNYNKLRQINN